MKWLFLVSVYEKLLHSCESQNNCVGY